MLDRTNNARYDQIQDDSEPEKQIACTQSTPRLFRVTSMFEGKEVRLSRLRPQREADPLERQSTR